MHDVWLSILFIPRTSLQMETGCDTCVHRTFVPGLLALPVTVQDLDRRILAWNRGAERMYGWSAEDIPGRMAEGQAGEGAEETPP